MNRKQKKEKEFWYKNCWRRILIDSAITTVSPEAYSQFDPKKLVRTIHESGNESVMFYIQCLTGYTFYPSKIGQLHPAFKGRDIFGEVLAECRKYGIHFVGYFPPNANNLMYERHPEWREHDWDATNIVASITTRPNVCCLNRPAFRKHIKDILTEVLTTYNIDGLFFDDPFMGRCACDDCQKRFLEETGMQFPERIANDNVDDSIYQKFLLCTRKWAAEAHQYLQNIVYKLNPDATVTFQFAQPPHGIQKGQTADVLAYADFVGRDTWQFISLENHSLICKVLRAYSPNLPNEHQHRVMWGGSTTLTPKPLDFLKVHASYSLSHNASVLWIENLIYDGRISQRHTARVKEVNEWMEPYTEYTGGDPIADVGIYHSSESALIPMQPTQPLTRLQWPFLYPFYTENYVFSGEHNQCIYGATKFLAQANIPFDLVTVRQLKKLKKYRVIILAAVEIMSKKEVDAFRHYVSQGGNLLITGRTSLRGEGLAEMKNFALSDVIGADYLGMTPQTVTYIAPTKEAVKLGLMEELFKSDVPQWYEGPQVKTFPKKGKILAHIVVPASEHPENMAERVMLHMYSPEKKTDFPSIIFSNYGKGKVVYTTADITKLEFDEYYEMTVGLVSLLGQGDVWTWKSDAPNTVEVLFNRQSDKHRYIAHLINASSRFPITPVSNIRVELNTGKDIVERVISIPGEKSMPFSVKNSYCEVMVPRIDDYLILSFNIKKK